MIAPELENGLIEGALQMKITAMIFTTRETRHRQLSESGRLLPLTLILHPHGVLATCTRIADGPLFSWAFRSTRSTPLAG